MTSPRLRRSLLFVPGSRPERFPKAMAADADIVCIDLEDAVLPADKAMARHHVIEALPQLARKSELAIRINTLRSRDGLEDILALARSDTPPDIVAIPKAESAAELAIVSAIFAEAGHTPLLAPLVETLAGLANADSICAAPHVAFVVLGTADLGGEMGIGMDWDAMLHARHLLVTAAKRAGVEAMDGAWLQLDDADGLAAETRRVAGLGFTAKICLHPRQVHAVHTALLPTEAEVIAARSLVEAWQAAATGAFQHQGKMIDLPVLNAARRKLAAWEREHGTAHTE